METSEYIFYRAGKIFARRGLGCLIKFVLRSDSLICSEEINKCVLSSGVGGRSVGGRSNPLKI
jgi:hypothetical protein